MSCLSCAVVVAKPGAMRDGWRALLMALPSVCDVEQVEDAPATLKAVGRLHPALVVVDANLLKEDTETLLRQIKSISPETRRMVLTETVEQQDAIKTTIAESVMLQGASATEIAITLERLLADRLDGK